MATLEPYRHSLGYGTANGDPAKILALAQYNARLPKATADSVRNSVSGYNSPFTEVILKPIGESQMRREDRTLAGTSHERNFPSPSRTVRLPDGRTVSEIEAQAASARGQSLLDTAAGTAGTNKTAANAGAAGAGKQPAPGEQRENPAAAKFGAYAEPTRFNVQGQKDQVYFWDVDGRRQTAIRHGTFPEKQQQQAQPQGLHYVPGGWANGGYSFEGSAEDRARFFAPVSGPGRAPRSDNDTFLALQREKAARPVEEPLPKRPEFPTDPKMGWQTKLAVYKADMDAYNQQLANRAGYRQAMDVEALRQQAKPTDPIEQARLERALALQERQAAQQAAYQQAQLDQRDREMAQNYLNSMPERQVQAARLGYQAMTNQAASDLLDAYRSGDQARIDRAGAVWNALNNTSEKKGDADKWEVREFEDENGDKVPVRVNLNTGEVNRINIDGLDARVKEAKQALLKDVGRYDRNNPEVKKLVAALESARTLEEVLAVQKGMESIGK